MMERLKILHLDDDPNALELYRELFEQLSCKPEVHTTTSGAEALSFLKKESFALFICDLRMPQMDGLQILTLVRRRFNHLRLAVLTAVTDAHVRLRAYEIGVDLFFNKPTSKKETEDLLNCLESFLIRDPVQEGFYGVQHKSLIDLIQLESLCRNSVVLKVFTSQSEGTLWFVDGDIIDAQTGQLSGEEAIYQILSWKQGGFESLPPEPGHPRLINSSVQNILLNAAQRSDENPLSSRSEHPDPAPGIKNTLQLISSKGVDFALIAPLANKSEIHSWGITNPEDIRQWMTSTLEQFGRLGTRLKGGDVVEFIGLGINFNIAVGSDDKQQYCLGFRPGHSIKQMRESMQEAIKPR